MFLAHCLLDPSTRYVGGASRPGAVGEIVERCLEHDIGIVQLPCPEQHAWGGVAKRRLLSFFGSAGTFRYGVLRRLLPVGLWYTTRVYRRLAREVADQMRDYLEAGVAILGVVGVDASPSCGVGTTLRTADALAQLAALTPETANADRVNAIVKAAVTPGRGLFTELLQAELRTRGIEVRFTAHDLVAELEGKRSSAAIDSLVPVS